MTAQETLELYRATGSVIIKDRYEVEFGERKMLQFSEDPDTGEVFWTEPDQWEEI